MEKLFEILNLGKVISIEKVDSSQNIVYKVITNNGKYLLKRYSSDAIKDEFDLSVRKKQIEISKVLNDMGILSILPIEFNNEYFVFYNNEYYLVYNYLDYKVLRKEDMTIEHIRILAYNMALIHRLNLEYDLSIQYREIVIDFEYYLNKFKDKEYTLKLYNLLIDNKDDLLELINNCNRSLSIIKDDLCISHNDYKLKNILWNKDKMYLIDFDATALSNPIVSLAESAFSLSMMNNKINYDFYAEYVRSYISVYGNFKTNYNDALICAMNGKLQWFKYLLDNSLEDNVGRVEDAICMIKELLLFINNRDKLFEVYKDIVKEKEVL